MYVTKKTNIWGTALYGAETWTLQKVDKEVLKCGAGEEWRAAGPTVWKNEDITQTDEGEEYPRDYKMEKGLLDWSYPARET